jgi:hypothetical protein
MEVDLAGICKTCVNWNNNSTRKTYKNILGKQYNLNAMVISKIPQDDTCKYRPGVMTLFTVNA